MLKTDFAILLKDLRASEGLTQEEMADELDVAVPTIRGWEQGRTTPRAKHWKTIKEKFGGSEIFSPLEIAYISNKRLRG